MAKKPTKKPAAKRGGAKKAAPQGAKKKGKPVAAKRAQARAAVRKPTARARNSALPHYDPVDVAFKEGDLPRHPTVEEQFRAEHPDDAVAPPRRGFWHRFRSAITGRWVTSLFAKRNPSTTVGERAE